jgi:hypothetical protein
VLSQRGSSPRQMIVNYNPAFATLASATLCLIYFDRTIRPLRSN